MVLQLSARPYIVSDKPIQPAPGVGIQALVDESPRMERAGNLMSLPGLGCVKTRYRNSRPKWVVSTMSVLTADSDHIADAPLRRKSAGNRSDTPASHCQRENTPSISIRLDLQQRKRAEDTRHVRRRRRVQIGYVELGEVFDAEQAQAPDHFVFEQLQHPQDPGFAGCGKRPALQAADADQIGAAGDRLDD